MAKRYVDMPGTEEMHSRCEEHTSKLSNTSAGRLASMMVTLLAECVAVQTHT
jgi:hypothetical protein